MLSEECHLSRGLSGVGSSHDVGVLGLRNWIQAEKVAWAESLRREAGPLGLPGGNMAGVCTVSCVHSDLCRF